MLPDTVEYGEWKTGIRDEGIIFGVNQLALKTASGIGISLLGIALEMIHYQANQVQSPETLQAIPQLVILLPLGLTILSAISIVYYPINKHIHGRLVRILEWRRARTFS
jgi:glycoside/pentoside/hexuronide:cation symporter, GPH family